MLKMYVTLQNMFIAGVDRVRDGERGATATEYALLVGLIAVVITVGIGAFGQSLLGYFNGLFGQLKI